MQAGSAKISFLANIGTTEPIGDGTGYALSVSSGSADPDAILFDGAIETASGIALIGNSTLNGNAAIGAGNTESSLAGNTAFNAASFSAERSVVFGNGTETVTFGYAGTTVIETTANNGSLDFNAFVSTSANGRLLDIETQGSGSVYFRKNILSSATTSAGTAPAEILVDPQNFGRLDDVVE